jgi:hypothetical protein
VRDIARRLAEDSQAKVQALEAIMKRRQPVIARIDAPVRRHAV